MGEQERRLQKNRKKGTVSGTGNGGRKGKRGGTRNEYSGGRKNRKDESKTVTTFLERKEGGPGDTIKLDNKKEERFETGMGHKRGGPIQVCLFLLKDRGGKSCMNQGPMGGRERQGREVSLVQKLELRGVIGGCTARFRKRLTHTERRK